MNKLNQEQVLRCYRNHAAPHVHTALANEVVVAGHGATLRCASGRNLIDLASGGFGYGHPRVKAAVTEQIHKAPLSSRILVSRPLAALVVRLAELAPGDLSVSYVCNSGEEAIDSAMKLVKGYWPSRHKVVAVAGGNYGTLSHGVYFAGIGAPYLTGLPLTPTSIPFNDIDAALREIDGGTAAVLLEPIADSDGLSIASIDYWRALRKRCDETGALLVVNEIRTGMGRAGRHFAIEHVDVVPDVLILGGALSGGFISIGAYITTEAINSRVYRRRNPTLHGSTTGANPASCASALAALDVMVAENFAERHAGYEDIFLEWAETMRREHDAGILSARAVGSFGALEFKTAAQARTVWEVAMMQGVLLREPRGRWLHMSPPLIINATEYLQALARIAGAVHVLGQSHVPVLTMEEVA